MKKINAFLLLPFIYIIISILFYIYKPETLNTNFFFATVTFLVGSFALFIYTKQKSDEKINAATTILLEVRNAENQIDIIIDKLDKNTTVDFPSVLPTNSWRKYSHLFVKDFDLDEIQLMNTFYTSCEIIEDLVNRQNNFFWITTEERTKVVQKMLAQIHDDFQLENLESGIEKAKPKFDARKGGLEQFYVNDSLSYAPEKTLKGLKFQTENLQRITSTPCGERLKKLASLK